MTNKLLKKLVEKDNYTNTENLCLTHKSTLSACLDLYSRGGAFRTRSEEDIIASFIKALSEDKAIATKLFFYLRDILEGQGERDTFRTMLRYFGEMYPEIVKLNIENIPHYGRFDDLYVLFGTKSEKYMVDYLKRQVASDLESEHPTLLGKWLKSSNKKSKHYETYKKIKHALGYTSEQYRKVKSALTRKIGIVESKMCANKWDKINFSTVPSIASANYADAFKKHQPERYTEYIESVKAGQSKINTKALYPYNIIRKIRFCKGNMNVIDTLNVLWDNLPNYCEKEENALVLADTSASMTWDNKALALDTCLSLAIYFAERNNGDFHDYFMGFSRVPTLYKVEGNNIYEKYLSVKNVNSYHENTDLIACFKLILDTAKENKTPIEEMPTRLFMISDMEFDTASQDNSKTAFQVIEKMYEDAGYKRPSLVFWNVNARNDQSPVTKDENNVFLVSGSSPVIFKHVMNSKTVTGIELMLEVLNSERYYPVKIEE